MGREIDLLRALPKTKRNIQSAQDAKDPAVIAHLEAVRRDVLRRAARLRLRRLPLRRALAAGGARHRRAFRPEARRCACSTSAAPRASWSRICCDVLPGLEVVRPRHLALCADALRRRRWSAGCTSARADRLPFPDGSFRLRVSLNTVHNFPRDRAQYGAAGDPARCRAAAPSSRSTAIARPSRKQIFESWVLTAEFHDYPEGWIELFDEAGYTGDYYWTIIE